MAIGDPAGVDLTSGTTDGNTLPDSFTGWEEREISLTSYELTMGTEYAIVVRAPEAIPFDDVHWIIESPSAISGQLFNSDDSGASWTGNPTYDAWFKTKAGAVEKDTYTPASESSFDTLSDTEWRAQTFVAGSTYTITSIVLKLQRFAFTSPGTITVSIQAVEGAPAPPEYAGWSLDEGWHLDQSAAAEIEAEVEIDLGYQAVRNQLSAFSVSRPFTIDSFKISSAGRRE